MGTFGTLIGAGGGFLLVPILLLIHPHLAPVKIATMSLAVVLANAGSGSVSYYRLRRADYRSGAVLALATLPGAILGAVFVDRVPRHAFDVILGLVLLAVSALLVFRPRRRLGLLTGAPLVAAREVRDSDGKVYRFRFNLGLAALLSLGIGFLSSLLGIGGGIIHVPLLIIFFEFPAHVATATSHFVLTVMAGAGTVTHLVRGDFAGVVVQTLALALGVLVGAPFGAALSRRVDAHIIVRLLAVGLAVVAVRLLIAGP